MAAQLLLLLLLINPVQAQVLQPAGSYHRFLLDETADFCSVTRWTSEGTQLLSNDSGSYYLTVVRSTALLSLSFHQQSVTQVGARVLTWKDPAARVHCKSKSNSLTI